MTCTITGYLRDPAGVPLSDTAITITAQAITASGDGAMLPRHVEAATDAAGLLAVDLLPGRYMLRWRSATQDYASPLSVPDEPAADLADLLVAAPLPVRGPEGPPGPPGAVDFGTITVQTGAPGTEVTYQQETGYLYIPRGDAGAEGPAGADGAAGAQGEAGPQGPKGDDGPPGAVDWGELTLATGPAGSDVGYADGILTIPRGDKGERGEDGPQGERGPEGPQGPQGLPGADGAKGDPGADGADGADGPAGAKGDTGDTGAPGAKGDKGDPGDAGLNGDKGDQGEPGLPGTKGDAGDSITVILVEDSDLPPPADPDPLHWYVRVPDA